MKRFVWNLPLILWSASLFSCVAGKEAADLDEEAEAVDDVSQDLVIPLGSALGSPVATGNTCGSSNEHAPSCGSSNASDISYTWTAPYAGTFTITTAGSSFDTILQIRSANGAVLACNDDASGSVQSAVSVGLTAGQQVTITVDGYGSSCGAHKLNIASPGNKGVTWRKLQHDSTRGQDQVNCDNCNGYQGDTSCTEQLPILCLNQDGSSSNGFVPSFYDGWAAGNIALSSPVVGSSLTSLSVADAKCAAELGPGWRMAEHHDGGGGWGWRAYGNIKNTSRFWVTVNNQPSSCWNSSP